MGEKKEKKLRKIGIGLLFGGIFLVVLGIVFGLVMPVIVRSIVINTLVVDNVDHPDYQKFMTPYGYVEYTFYPFNITNMADVQAGASPIVEQIGPYSYDQAHMKMAITYNDDASEVSYIKYSYYLFNESRSVGNPDTDIVYGLNAAWISTIAQAGGETMLMFPFAQATFASFVTYFSSVPYQEKVFAYRGQDYLSDKYSELVTLEGSATSFCSIWANSTTTPAGWTNLTLNAASTGPSEISLSSCLALWDIATDHSFMKNPLEWANIDASGLTSMATEFDLTSTQVTMVRDWLRLVWGTQVWLIVKVDCDIETKGQIGFCQWGNGGAFGITEPGASASIEMPFYVGNTNVNLTTAKAFNLLMGENGIVLDYINLGTLFELAINMPSAVPGIFGITAAEAVAVVGYFQNFIIPTYCIPQYGGLLDAGSGMIASKTVHEFIFGKIDPLMNALGLGFPVGFFTNDTNVGYVMGTRAPHLLGTGAGDLSKIQWYSEYEGVSTIDFWDEEEIVQGTTADQFEPFLKDDLVPVVWSSDLQRAITLERAEDVTVQEILTATRFRLPSSLLEANDKYLNTLEGFANMQPDPSFAGAPLHLSKPHFLDAPSSWLDLLGSGSNLSPNAEIHDTFLDIDCLLGTTISARQRLQINYLFDSDYITSHYTLPFWSNIPEDIMWPAIWIEKGAVIPMSSARTLKSKVYGSLSLGVVLMIVLICLGAVGSVVGVFLFKKNHGLFLNSKSSKVKPFVDEA